LLWPLLLLLPRRRLLALSLRRALLGTLRLCRTLRRRRRLLMLLLLALLHPLLLLIMFSF
jgi:hypothetical protein